MVLCQESAGKKPGRFMRMKGLAEKLGLRKAPAVRVTTPPAPRGTRYDMDLYSPSYGMQGGRQRADTAWIHDL